MKSGEFDWMRAKVRRYRRRSTIESGDVYGDKACNRDLLDVRKRDEG